MMLIPIPKYFSMDFSFFKIVVFTPLSHSEAVRKALGEAGAGHIDHYDFCSFASRGIGRFRPLKGAQPFIGQENQVEEVEEERLEVICPKNMLKKILVEIKKAHPYEKPAIDIYPLLEASEF